MQKKAFFFKNIWSYQKKAVPLHPLLKKKHVFLAQLVEQLTLNQWVQGSSPWEDTKDIRKGVLCVAYKQISLFYFIGSV